jgi:hypothetical protein
MSDRTPPRPDDTSGATPGAAPEEGLGPPPGQDGSPPTSEFLTPVRPYETVDPDGDDDAWPAPSSGSPADAPPHRRRSGIGAAVAAVVLVAGGLAWIVADHASTGSVGAPRDLRATAGVCAAPTCERIDAFATLTWSPPDGDVDAYQVLRARRVIATVRTGATTYEARDLRIQHSYVFGVRAIRGTQRGPTTTVEVRTPAPPLAEAQLTGVYRVRERVRSASNLTSIEGIRHPRPGSSTVNTWSFEAACEPAAGACATSWFSWGPVRNAGTRYEGTLRTRPASCGDGRPAPTTTDLHLTVVSGRTVDGRWTVGRFRGSMRIAFRCAGAARSIGVLNVDGSLRSG